MAAPPTLSVAGGAQEDPLDWKFVQSFGDDNSSDDDLVTAVEFDETGQYLAVGDKAGRICIFEGHQVSSSPHSNKRPVIPLEYKFYTEFQSHEPEFDCLKSLEIEEKINMIKWGKKMNNGLFLLACNDKTIKYWKVHEKKIKRPARLDGPPVSMANTPTYLSSDLLIPKLTHHQTITTATPKRVYSNAHGYHVNCFPEDDHEILTAHGFMGLAAIEEHFAQHEHLSVACPLRDGSLAFRDISVAELVVSERGEHQHIAMDNVAVAYERAHATQGSIHQTKGNQVSLCPTANHTMWVRIGAKDNFHLQSWKSISAADVAAATLPRADPFAQFQASVSEGVRGSLEPLPIVASLGLRSEDEVLAFLELYGYWLGDGWLDALHGWKVAFGPVKKHDVTYLDGLFTRLRLPRLAKSSEGKHGYWRADKKDAGGKHNIHVVAPAYVEFFRAEYASKYGGSAASATSSPASSRSASKRSSPASSREASPVSKASRYSASAASFSSGRPSELEERPAGWCCEMACSLAGEAECATTGELIAFEKAPVPAPAAAAAAAAEPAPAAAAAAAAVPAPAAAAAATVQTTLDAHLKLSGRPSNLSVCVEPERIKSAKWFCWWVLRRCSARQLRAIIAGLRFADGNEAAKQATGGCIGTSSARFRDELTVACLFAGYTTHFYIDEVGESRGVNKQGVEIIARNTHWKVAYTSDQRSIQPSLSCAREMKRVSKFGRVWCVTVPTQEHWIMARRVRERTADGIVRSASRPVVVGNSISINSDGETFISADDLRINLWNLQIANETFNVVDVKPPNLEELTEVITSATFHPQACSQLIYSSSRGSIRLADLRDSALCDQHAKLFEVEEDPSQKSFFSEIISSISDAQFIGPEGRFILSRDYLTLKVWDVQMESRPLAVIPIHEYLKVHLCDLYENDCIFDKFEAASSADGSRYVTGSYNNHFVIHHTLSQSNVTIEALKDPPKRKPRPVKPGAPAALKKPDTSPVSANETTPDTPNVNLMDFGKKALHVSYHPSQHVIAVAGLNKLYIYQAINANL